MPRPAADLLLTNVLLADGRRGMAIVIQSGRIAAILPPDTPLPEARETTDLAGDLVLPALADGHMHLDKTLFGLPWWPHQAEPVRASRIETDQRVLPNLPKDTEARASALFRRCVAFGTGHIFKRKATFNAIHRYDTNSAIFGKPLSYYLN